MAQKNFMIFHWVVGKNRQAERSIEQLELKLLSTLGRSAFNIATSLLDARQSQRWILKSRARLIGAKTLRGFVPQQVGYQADLSGISLIRPSGGLSPSAQLLLAVLLVLRADYFGVVTQIPAVTVDTATVSEPELRAQLRKAQCDAVLDYAGEDSQTAYVEGVFSQFSTRQFVRQAGFSNPFIL
jgi:hypothetical protein